MRFAITGATGLLGNNLTRILLHQGHEVRVAVRPGSDPRPLQGLSVEIATGDLNDSDFARHFIKGCQGLIHCAGIIWFGNTRYAEAMRVNVDATTNLAEKCRDAGIRMVFVSSVDSLAAGKRNQPANELSLDPAKGQSAYVTSKRAAERQLLKMHAESGLNIVIGNPGLMLGPFDWKPSSGRMILAVTDGYMPLAPWGGVTVADVRQIAKGLISAMESGTAGERYILGGTNLLYLELWRKMAGLVGRKGPLSRLGPFNGYVTGKAVDLWSSIKGKETEVNSAGIAMSSRYNYYDSSKAQQQLGYDPGNLETALNDAWQWLRENGYTNHST